MKIKELMMLRKRGALTLAEMPGAFIILVAGIITVGVAAIVLRNLFNTQAAGSISAQIINNGSQALLDASTLFPVTGIIIVAAVIIGLVFLFRS